MQPAPRTFAHVPDMEKYHLVAELARGGMGDVYLAALQGPGGFQKLIAIKALKPELCDDDTFVAMFLEEARLAARLHHPNIVQTNEVASALGQHYIVMEYLDGRSLHRIGRRFVERGGFPLGAHLRVLAEALRGLQYAHELAGFDGEPLGIVHRDVSPLNVIVTFDGQAKVLDFGIAKCGDSSLETKAGVLKGRIAYMAPEQAYGAPVDRRADVYSVGVMIWEAVAGRRLWSGMTDVEILARLLGGEPPTLRSACPHVPAALEAMCRRAMARKQNDRYPSAAALIDDLERYLASREDAMSMRDIGVLLDRVFCEERRQTNRLIEDTLIRVRVGTRSGVMPAMKRASDRSSPDGARPAQDGEGLPSALASAPSARTATPSDPGMHDGTQRFTGLPMPRLHRLHRLHPKTRTNRAALLGGCVVLALVAAGFAWRARARTPAAAGPTAGTSLGAPPAIKPAIRVAIRVAPADAQISIDGERVGNPLQAEFPDDDRMHHLMAFADGYETKSQEVAFTRDVALDIDLERLALLPRSTTSVVTGSSTSMHVHTKGALDVGGLNPTDAARTGSSSPHPDLGPAAGRAPSRPITTSNPYGPPQ